MALKNLGAIFGKEGDRLQVLYSVQEMEAYPRSYATMPGRCSRRLPGAWLKAKEGRRSSSRHCTRTAGPLLSASGSRATKPHQVRSKL